jgi:hypothetical protein
MEYRSTAAVIPTTLIFPCGHEGTIVVLKMKCRFRVIASFLLENLIDRSFSVQDGFEQ